MGRRGGRGAGGGRGRHGRRDDERPGGSRDDRDMRDRRPVDRGARDNRRPDDRGMRDRPRPDPRRSPSPGYRLRSPSPDRRPRSPSPNRRPRRSRSLDHGARRLRDDDGGRDPPRRGQGDYVRVPYHQERERYDHPGRADRSPRGSYNQSGRGNGSPRRSYDGRGDRGPNRSYDGRGDRRTADEYDAPPAYMLPEHPSDLGRAAKDDFFGGPGGRSINEVSELYGDNGSTGLGRTGSPYRDRRSPPLPPPPPFRDCRSPPLPPLPAMLPSPRPLYPSVPPTATGFLTGGSTRNVGESFGAGTARLPHDDSGFQYGDRLPSPYVGGREIERLGPGRDSLVDRNGEMDRIYPSRGELDSDIAPAMQLNGYAGSSSSVLTKDRPYRVHDESYEPSNGYEPGSAGHGSGHAHLFSESSLERGSGHDKIPLDISRQTHSKHKPRAASMDYAEEGYGRRGPANDTYLAAGNLYGNDSRDSRASIRHTLITSTLTDLEDGRSNRQVRLSRRMGEDEHAMEYKRHHSYHGDTPMRYSTSRDAHIRYSRSPTDPREIARRPIPEREFASFEDGFEFSDQEVSPMAYRRGLRGAAYGGHDMDICQTGGPPGQESYSGVIGRGRYSDEIGRGRYDDAINAYDLSPKRMSRSYDDDEDGYNARYDVSTSRDVFSRIALPNNIQGNPNMLAHGRLKYKPISQRLSRPMVQPQLGGSAMLGRGRGGWTKGAKKRLRAGLPQFNGGYTSERNEVVRPNKSLKLSEDNQKGTESNHEDASDEEDLSVQKDPPEGSEEFSKQVHEAFLKFSKILNESPAMQKRYREAAKGSLSCCVCGSVARKFPDIDALMSHAYDTCKLGLKTKHLGLHKALCVLMGWDVHVAPDVHNSSITNKTKAAEAKVVSIEEIEGVLADIGVACGKAKVTHGKPANQSVFVVKFLPTISGFQEAMRIDEHFAAENHGKEDLQQIRGEKGKSAAPADKLEELLYAHVAVAEDLGYLDDETKKRCVVRSKSEIEAKANATLNLDS
ncbi:uncharacterized protein LOC104584771 isoform X2 [Brachypodium distachyon]|uniref:XS domain-containing protein n=1 Tax=Brachypodium distachyon TaxID=15368 RepID=A0A0Q3LHD9_BRADI|nr:uncharacterized protein LOC104584771 isoform X2 [Brachypodium distachyon]KQJ92045.1 hypothetical protein BRADI_4g41390v3 [Brachypodium distachyon]|eukprot:XP_010238668.1 uncharacterized protein LOC104584771 isoform X2 [Brachypodium distachyon]